MKKLFLLILVLSIAAFKSSLSAQSPFLKHHELFRGKEEYNVNIIYQDPRGLIWFGTDRGLFRFDGVAYTAFTIADSLAGNNITALHFTNEDILWIGHKNGKISLYDGNSISQLVRVVWAKTRGRGVLAN